MNKKLLKEYDLAVDNLAKYFIKKYFGKDYILEDNVFWVGSNEDKGVLVVNDYFFDLENIIDFIKYKYTEDEVFVYYDYMLERLEKKKTYINIKNWRKLKELRKRKK